MGRIFNNMQRTIELENFKFKWKFLDILQSQDYYYVVAKKGNEIYTCTFMGKNLKIWAKMTQVSNMAHDPLVSIYSRVLVFFNFLQLM
jgi:hypothetical protein